MENLKLRSFLREQGYPVQKIFLVSHTIHPEYDFTQYSTVLGIISSLGKYKIRPVYQRYPKLDRSNYYLCISNPGSTSEEHILFRSPDWATIQNESEEEDLLRWENWK